MIVDIIDVLLFRNLQRLDDTSSVSISLRPSSQLRDVRLLGRPAARGHKCLGKSSREAAQVEGHRVIGSPTLSGILDAKPILRPAQANHTLMSALTILMILTLLTTCGPFAMIPEVDSSQYSRPKI